MPNRPWTVRSDMPQAMKEAIQTAISEMETRDPEGWQTLTEGLRAGYSPAVHAEYADIIEMIDENRRVKREQVD